MIKELFSPEIDEKIQQAKDTGKPMIFIYVDTSGQIMLHSNVQDKIYAQGMLTEISQAIGRVKTSNIVKPSNGEVNRLS